jgi:hypothetical protein
MARRDRYRPITPHTGLSLLFFATLFWPMIGVAADTATLALVPAKAEAGQGQRLSINVEVIGARDLFSAPFYIRYDPKHLKVIHVEQGEFLKHGGANTAFLHNEKKSGTVMVGVSRLGNQTGVNGSGTLATLTFITLGAGRTTISVSKSDLKDSQLAPAKVRIEDATITIGAVTAH